MILVNRILPFFSTALIAATFEIWIVQPSYTYYIALILFLIVVLTIRCLTSYKFISKNYWNFLFSPLLFIAGAYTFFLLIDNTIVSHIFVIIICATYLLIMSNIFSFVYKSQTYQPYALENINSYLNLVSLFMFSASFFGMMLLLGWSVWLSTILVCILSLFLCVQTFWSFKVDWKISKLYIVTAGLLSAEGFFILSFLPTNHLFNGLILVIIYYLFINFAKDHLTGVLAGKSVKKYLIISLSISVVAILTAQWY